EKLVSKGKYDPDGMSKVLGLLIISSKMDDAQDADLVIEAAPEEVNIKKEIFSALDKICPAHTIFATNTSSISISSLNLLRCPPRSRNSSALRP
ncbi:MAG: hypothetical protein JRF05_05650, partial [Deltaproteobacteria bacterium]|nr:hypothetical protein [Deltaproteobacteria bacterium]